MRSEASEKKKLLLLLLINSAVLISLYFVVASYGFPIYILYLVAGAGLGIGFIVYNRGFAAKDATPYMLPDSMTYEEKLAFLEDCRTRLAKSKWMLTVILPILFAFAFDMFYLFVLPNLEAMFS